MVAFAKWQYPHTLSAEQQAEQEKVDQNKEPRPKGTNTELLKIFMDALDERRKKWIDEAEGYCKSSNFWNVLRNIHQVWCSLAKPVLPRAIPKLTALTSSPPSSLRVTIPSAPWSRLQAY